VSFDGLIPLVITGGPGAGKTVVTRRLAEDDAWTDWRNRLGGVTTVPEAATQVYSARNTRWDRLDHDERREVQRQIYHFQREQEARLADAARTAGCRVLLLDRGTVDGSAYWPDGPAAYWNDLGVDVSAELARYDGVVLLSSVARLGAQFYDGDASNAVRFESPDEALASDRLLGDLWGEHPTVRLVDAFEQLEDKVRDVARVIGELAD
jgi:predicted ATPase